MSARDNHSKRSVVLAGVMTLVAALGLAGCAVSVPADLDTREVNFEGLAEVRSRSLDVAQVRPGVDFSTYTAYVLEAPELAYRMPDRAAGEVGLTSEQQDRFAAVLAQAFESEFEDSKRLQRVDGAGPGTLAIRVRVRDIRASVSEKSVSSVGRGAAFAQASGTATLIVELSDSASNELLARGVDREATQGAAMVQGRDMVTRFQDVEVLSKKWASVARKSVESLLGSR